jgi:anti-anti-sigma regulatory factor
MWIHLRNWLKNIPLNDPIERRQAPLIQAMLLGLITVGLLAVPHIIFSANNNSGALLLNLFSVLLSASVCMVGLIQLRRGRFSSAIAIVIIGLLVSSMLLLAPRGLNSSWIAFFVLAIPITFAGLLASRRVLWLTVALSIAIICGIGILAEAIPSLVGYDAPGAQFSAQLAISFTLVAGLLGLSFDRFGSALRDALSTSLQREQELEQVREAQELVIGERTTELQNALEGVRQREANLVETLSELRASQQAVQELSAPVIPVLAGVLVAPLIGALDGERAARLTGNLLSAVAQQHAGYVIFDITGVPVVDTHVAQVLIQTTSALRLLGAQVLLVGIRPEVAQTMVALNVDLDGVATYADLRDAIESLLPLNGWQRAYRLDLAVAVPNN